MPVRNRRAAAFSAPRATVEARHLGAGSRLVEEDEMLRIKLGLLLEPLFARRVYQPTSLFGGMRSLFLSVILRRSKKRQIEPIPAARLRPSEGPATRRV
jgi:hypothetical protein